MAVIIVEVFGVGIIVVAFSPPVALWSYRRVPVDPKNCRMDAKGKFNCWDGQENGSFDDCSINHHHDVLMKGVPMPELGGEVTCHKSVAWNMETNTGCLVVLFCLFLTVFNRALEQGLKICFSDRFRLNWGMALAAATQIQPICYSVMAFTKHLKDRNYNTLASQCYFTSTEIFVFTVVCFRLNTKNRPAVMSLCACGTALLLALFHLSDLMDGSATPAKPRNHAFVLGDLTSVFIFLHEFTTSEGAAFGEISAPPEKLIPIENLSSGREPSPTEQDHLP